uniref:Uncharacterized protein n=1 Tax=Angiostrongylus cantonensis TaxID=6313 RepID=A0A0K0DBV6_ANGCA
MLWFLGVEFTRHASQFIGCVAAYVVEMKRCVALEKTFPAPTEPSITPQQVRGALICSSCLNFSRYETQYDVFISIIRLDFSAFSESQNIANMESMLVTLENLITVHFSTSESSPTDKVTPRRRRATSCRPQCVCSKLKTSYA